MISPKSGRIFEKKLITTYLSTNSTDPISDEPLTQEELIPVNTQDNTVVPPKPPAFNSIPSLLETFQNEFDSMALEVFSLRKQLHKSKQELSSALYHYDAAVKVAANAIKERDEAKTALQELTLSLADNAMNTEEDDIGLEVPVPAEEIEEARQLLFQLHKSHKIALPPFNELEINLAPKTLLKSYNLYYYDSRFEKLMLSGTREITIIDMATDEQKKITTKGIVGSVNLIELDGIVTPIYANKKQIKFEDKTIKYKDEVVDIQSHPTLKSIYAVICLKSWTLNVQDKISRVVEFDEGISATVGGFHVDGALVAIGTDQGKLLIYSIADGQLASNLSTKYPTVKKVVFGLNGYWVLVSSGDETRQSLEIFDLRKSVVIQTFDFDSLTDFAIDGSCSLLLTCNDEQVNIHRYTKKDKKWQENIKMISANVDYLEILLTDDTIKALGLNLSELMNCTIEFN